MCGRVNCSKIEPLVGFVGEGRLVENIKGVWVCEMDLGFGDDLRIQEIKR